MKREYKRGKSLQLIIFFRLQYLGQNDRNGCEDHKDRRVGNKRESLAELPGKFTSFTNTRYCTDSEN